MANIQLPAPTKVDDDPLYTLASTVRTQFKRVVLLNEDGEEAAILISTENEDEEVTVGQGNFDYICGLILGATGGRGNGPDGAAIWAANHADQMEHLNKYTLLAEPAKRGTTLEAPVENWKAIVNARAEVLEPSLEKYPPEKRSKVTVIGDDDEEPEVVL